MSSESKKHDLTVGSPGRVLVKFTFPLLVSAAFQQLYNIADSIIVGRSCGKDALAAVGASYPVTMLFVAAALGISTGASVVIARHYGAKEYGNVKTGSFTSLISSTGFGLVLALIGYLLGAPLLSLMGTAESIMKDSVSYLNIYLLGVVFMFLYNTCTGIFTALGDSVTPLILLVISSLGNICLDILFVVIFNKGVEGAAWATFLCQSVCAIIAFAVLLIRLYRLKTDEPVKLYSRKMQRSISRISIPGMLQQSFVSVGNLFIQSFVNQFGVNALAGYQSAIKLNTFTVTVMATMSNGASSFTAQNLGAGKVERIRKGFKNCIAIMCGTAVVLSVIFTVFAPQLAGLFLDSSAEDNKEALLIGTTFLRIVSPAFCIVAAKLCCDGFLKGGGAMKEFMIGTFADLLLRVILSLVLSRFFDVTGIWMSWPIGWFIAACMSFYYYKKDRWLHSN